jgi:hypothetical protein
MFMETGPAFYRRRGEEEEAGRLAAMRLENMHNGAPGKEEKRSPCGLIFSSSSVKCGSTAIVQ